MELVKLADVFGSALAGAGTVFLLNYTYEYEKLNKKISKNIKNN